MSPNKCKQGEIKTQNAQSMESAPSCVTGIRIHDLSLMNASSTWHGVRFFKVRCGRWVL